MSGQDQAAGRPTRVYAAPAVGPVAETPQHRMQTLEAEGRPIRFEVRHCKAVNPAPSHHLPV